MTPPSWIAFDPGVNTGVVEWDDKATPILTVEMKQEALDQYLETLDTSNLKAFIIEEYRVYGSVNHTGSKVYTIQVIGQLKAFARGCKSSVKVIEQGANVKGVAAKWSGMKIPKGHMPDWMAAYLHGYYYLYREGLIRPRVLDTYNK